MAAENSHETIANAFLWATKKHGESPTARAMCRVLLEDVIGKQAAYARANERRVTNAEKLMADLLGDDE